jgi:flagella basal body P-ring formation protein FlgA
MRATLAPVGGARAANAAVRRGENVTLTFAAPGVRIATSARALEDAAVGESIRLVNLSSNRTINATVTAQGAATAQ